MSGDRGQAREFPAGRLAAGLADDDDLELDQILRPRARMRNPEPTRSTTQAPGTDTGTETTGSPEAQADQTRRAPRPGDAAAPAPRADAPSRRGRGGRPPQTASGPPEAIKASTVQVPVALLAGIKTTRDSKGLTNGEIIIEAIEATYERLRELIHPPTTGGSLFAARSTKSNRSVDGPLAPLNVRLRNADWEVIDRLVDDVDAFSRGHLITVCLKAYYDLD